MNEERRQYFQARRKRAIDKLSLENIVSSWEELLD